MEDFLKYFKDNLENHPEPDYEEKDWQAMQKRLDRKGRARPVFVWRWAAVPLFLLLLLSNGYFYQELKKSNEKISLLENKYTKHIHQTDTIYISRVIYQTDTVFMTHTVTQYIGSTIEREISLQGNCPIADLNKKSGILARDSSETDHVLAAIINVENKKSHASFENNNSSISSDKLDINKIGTIDIPCLFTRNNTHPNLPIENAVSEKNKSLLHYLYAMQPNDLQTGLTAGPIVPFSRGLKPLGSFTTGVEALVGFNLHVQMWVNANYSKLRFMSKAMDEESGVPTIPLPNPSDLILDVEIPLNSLQFSFGMKYVFIPSKKYKPFIGAGIGASSLLPYQITYNFVDQLTGEETIREKGMNGSGLVPGLLFLRSGFTHDISTKYKFMVSGEYRHNLKGNDFHTPNVFGVQGSIFYRF